MEENSQMDHLRTVSQKEEEVHSSEIESLQEDISELVQNINNFILNETKTSISASENYEYTNDSNTEEKEDSTSEKHLGDDSINGTAIEPCSTNGELEIAEVDWSVAGPVLQKHVDDLVKVHTLNTAASALIRRMKALAIKKSISDRVKLSDNEENTTESSNLDSNL